MSHGSRKNTEKDWVKVTGTKRAQKHAQDKFQGRETKSRYSTISIASTEEEGKSDDVFENDPAVLPTVEDEDDNVFEEGGDGGEGISDDTGTQPRKSLTSQGTGARGRTVSGRTISGSGIMN